MEYCSWLLVLYSDNSYLVRVAVEVIYMNEKSGCVNLFLLLLIVLLHIAFLYLVCYLLFLHRALLLFALLLELLLFSRNNSPLLRGFLFLLLWNFLLFFNRLVFLYVYVNVKLLDILSFLLFLLSLLLRNDL